MDCKRALQQSQGNSAQAIILLRSQGHRVSPAGDQGSSGFGMIAMYNHFFGKIGAMVEVRCQTDFAAKTPEFIKLCNHIAMHVAWAKPKHISRDDVPPAVIECMVGEFQEVFEKYCSEACLMDQLEMKASQGTKTIGQMIAEESHRLGEKITVVRFSRFALGESDAH